MEYEPISGRPVRFPPGRIQVRLNQNHRRLYRALYSHYQSILANLPVLRDRDFDGRAVLLTPTQLDALDLAFKNLTDAEAGTPGNAFGSQEADRIRLFKRLQYLS